MLRRKIAEYWGALRSSAGHWQRDDGFLLSAGLGYYASVSLFPICLLLLAGLGRLSKVSPAFQDQQGELLAMVNSSGSPWLADQLRKLLTGIETQAAVGGPVGLVTLLVTAIGVFVQLDAAIARIWAEPVDPGGGIGGALKTVLHDRIVAFLMLLGVGTLVLVVFLLNLVLTAIRTLMLRWIDQPVFWHFVQILVTIGLNWLLFTL